MKKSLLLLSVLALLTLSYSLNAQDVQKLNGYNYLHIYPITYNSGQTDIYGIMSVIRGIFVNKGFGYISDFSDPSQQFADVVSNPCLVLYCVVTHEAPTAYTNAKLTLSFRNCYNQTIYETWGKGGMASTYQRYFEKAASKALSDFNNMRYSFDSSLTPKIKYPEVEQTNLTENDLRNYFDSNKLAEIEGIYKSYQSESLGFYEIGIKRYGNEYKAIIIDSDYDHWKKGEVKAVFEPSSMKGFYSTMWYMGNKTPFETFAMMENPALLSVEFKNQETGEKRNDRFIKMYPQLDEDISTSVKPKSSGSGFFITSNGILATNAHVIENAESLEVQISNEIGRFEYSAKVLLVDNQNDVALVQIDDPDFKGLSEIPYSLVENADIGEKVFTIGYPLNTVMGSNYKVTDGIVSSASGISDDLRYYQISVPLQPGNSGGPLFNKNGDVIGITSAQLNGAAVGTNIENVNYAIKISYLINLYKMLPNSQKLESNSKTTSQELQQQVKALKNYVCLINVN
jgi:S1-C subfamily serine protease